LRLICNNRMYRIQSDADAGKIGGAIRLIMNKKKGYKMECLIDGDECTRDPDMVDKRAYEHFKDWFYRSDGEKEEGCAIDEMIRGNNWVGFQDKAREMGIDTSAAKMIWEAMKKKKIDEVGKKEGADLSNYVPTYEEFEDMIKKMNPNSTGGISGLTYHMVQKWEERVKKKVYEELKGSWIRREVPKGWGDSMLAPIPKVIDPTLTELRPLMLFEVLRKIWTGLIMGKIREFWKKMDLLMSVSMDSWEVKAPTRLYRS